MAVTVLLHQFPLALEAILLLLLRLHGGGQRAVSLLEALLGRVYRAILRLHPAPLIG